MNIVQHDLFPSKCCEISCLYIGSVIDNAFPVKTVFLEHCFKTSTRGKMDLTRNFPFLDKYHERPGGPGMAEYIGDRGKGGRLYDPKNNITVKILRYGHQCIAGAGGGFHEDGAGYLKGWGGKAFLHGGMGGKIRKRQFSALHGMSDKSGADGGFGGGGASSLLPGGGGGFFGGDVRGAYMYKKWAIHAVGGSSYNVAIYPIITSGVHKKHGRVFVMFLGKEAIPFSGNYTEDLRVPKTFEKWYENS